MPNKSTETAPEMSDSPKNDTAPADESAMTSDLRDDEDDSLSWVDESSEESSLDKPATVAKPSDEYSPRLEERSSNDAMVKTGYTNLPSTINVDNTSPSPATQELADSLYAQQLKVEFDTESAQSFRNNRSHVEDDVTADKEQTRPDKGGKFLKDI
jgi:hypothetical protein